LINNNATQTAPVYNFGNAAGGSNASICSFTAAIGNFITADNWTTIGVLYRYWCPLALAVEFHIISTTNMVKVSAASSTNTAVEPSGHSMYEPNIMVNWDLNGYGSQLQVTDVQKIPMMPNTKNLHINGHATRFVYHLPKYAYGRSTTLPAITTLVSGMWSTTLDSWDKPGQFNFYWIDIGDYLSSATATQAATLRIEMQASVVAEFISQSIYSGQP
jgi:hypothetical protein